MSEIDWNEAKQHEGDTEACEKAIVAFTEPTPDAPYTDVERDAFHAGFLCGAHLAREQARKGLAPRPVSIPPHSCGDCASPAARLYDGSSSCSGWLCLPCAIARVRAWLSALPGRRSLDDAEAAGREPTE